MPGGGGENRLEIFMDNIFSRIFVKYLFKIVCFGGDVNKKLGLNFLCEFFWLGVESWLENRKTHIYVELFAPQKYLGVLHLKQ